MVGKLLHMLLCNTLILASSNTCMSITVTDSCFSGIYYISTLVSVPDFHLTHLCLIVDGITLSQGNLR